MTRSMLRDALSALAAVTLVSTAAGSPASAQAKSIKSYQAEVGLRV
jgi:DNA-binding FadR family transcriptional regulator